MPSEAAIPTFADLQRELPASTPRAWHFATLRAASRAGALVSDGLRIGYRHGFESGPFMDHVYADTPSGRTPVSEDGEIIHEPAQRALHLIERTDDLHQLAEAHIP